MKKTQIILEDEFSLLVMFVLQEIQMILNSPKTDDDNQQNSSTRNGENFSDSDNMNGDTLDDENVDIGNITLLFRLQSLCFSGIALLDGGLR